MPTINQEAEEAVIGSVALDGTCIALVADFLEPQHFISPQHQIVYAAMLTLYRKGEPIDVVTIQTELQRTNSLTKAGGPTWVQSQAFMVAHSAFVERYARIVQTNGEKVKLVKQLSMALTLACQPDTSIEDVWAAIPQHTRQGAAWNVHTITLPKRQYATG